MEERLRKVASKVTWKPCESSSCKLETFDSYETSLKVPWDYYSNSSSHSSESLNLYVQKFKNPNTEPELEIIFLAGGPGGIGRTYDSHIKLLLTRFPLPVTCYTFDHRGLGKSGVFTDLPTSEWINNVSKVIENAPFPLKHLNLTNAALDVGLLATVIKSQRINSKIILYGFSHGALWGNHVLQKIPNLFHAAFLSGVPHIKGLNALPTHQGLVDACEAEPFCREHFGGTGNVKETLRSAIINVTNPNYNSCTRQFYNTWKRPPDSSTLPQGHILMLLLENMINLIRNSIELNDCENVIGVQLLLAFIISTNDCLEAGEYQRKVLGPLSKFMSQVKGVEAANNSESSTLTNVVNSFVNAVMMIDTEFDYSQYNPILPANHEDLHIYPAFAKSYHKRWVALSPYITREHPTEQLPAVTRTTRVFISQSDMDFITPPQPGWELFKKIEAPVKGWLKYGMKSHDTYIGDCLLKWMVCGILDKDCSEVEACVEMEDRSQKLDWSFSNCKEFTSIWDLTKVTRLDGRKPLPIYPPRYLLEKRNHDGDHDDHHHTLTTLDKPSPTTTINDNSIGYRPWDPVPFTLKDQVPPDNSIKSVGFRPWNPIPVYHKKPKSSELVGVTKENEKATLKGSDSFKKNVDYTTPSKDQDGKEDSFIKALLKDSGAKLPVPSKDQVGKIDPPRRLKHDDDDGGGMGGMKAPSDTNSTLKGDLPIEKKPEELPLKPPEPSSNVKTTLVQVPNERIHGKTFKSNLIIKDPIQKGPLVESDNAATKRKVTLEKSNLAATTTWRKDGTTTSSGERKPKGSELAGQPTLLPDYSPKKGIPIIAGNSRADKLWSEKSRMNSVGGGNDGSRIKKTRQKCPKTKPLSTRPIIISQHPPPRPIGEPQRADQILPPVERKKGTTFPKLSNSPSIELKSEHSKDNNTRSILEKKRETINCGSTHELSCDGDCHHHERVKGGGGTIDLVDGKFEESFDIFFNGGGGGGSPILLEKEDKKSIQDSPNVNQSDGSSHFDNEYKRDYYQKNDFYSSRRNYPVNEFVLNHHHHHRNFHSNDEAVRGESTKVSPTHLSPQPVNIVRPVSGGDFGGQPSKGITAPYPQSSILSYTRLSRQDIKVSCALPRLVNNKGAQYSRLPPPRHTDKER